MKIRNKAFKGKTLCSDDIKSLALSLFMLNSQKSTLSGFSYNKLHNITGLHITTLKKRVKYLIKEGYAFIVNNTITFKSLKSRHENRNINLSTLEKNLNDRNGSITVKDYEQILNAILVTLPIRQKDFCRNLIEKRNNPKSFKELKQLKKESRKFGYESITSYNEFGISYDTLALKTKTSRGTAFKYIKYAVDNNMISKQSNKHKFQVSLDYVGSFKEYANYCIDNNLCTYFTINGNIMNLVKVSANVYHSLIGLVY